MLALALSMFHERIRRSYEIEPRFLQGPNLEQVADGDSRLHRCALGEAVVIIAKQVDLWPLIGRPSHDRTLPRGGTLRSPATERCAKASARTAIYRGGVKRPGGRAWHWRFVRISPWSRSCSDFCAAWRRPFGRSFRNGGRADSISWSACLLLIFHRADWGDQQGT
jgi:hypothetical protein